MIALAPSDPSPYPGASNQGLFQRQLPSGWIITALIGWLGLDQLLLWRFLDVAPVWAYPLGTLLIGGLCAAILRAMPSRQGPSLATLAICLIIALLLLALGGEGRFFYANIDWQVRYAVMRDMAINPWPFVYAARVTPDVLRAPIGMFLAPALAAKAFGPRAADIALLLQNGLMLGGLLALGSTFFESRKARLIAVGIFLCFSGIDAVGSLLLHGRLGNHLEDWIGIQYSSTVTLAFWVPQHAMAGWIGAIGYLLWRTDRLPLAAYLSLLPLTALWSPLGLMGALPFAALAGLRTLTQGKLRAIDIALPALASLLCIPSLLYLGAAASGEVGIRLQPIPVQQWLLFQTIETLPFLVPMLLTSTAVRFGRDTLWLGFLWLMVIPFVQIGWSIDFMMRASITALAIVPVMLADLLPAMPRQRPWLIAMLAIGSLTGLAEIRRAVTHPPAPEVRCTFFKAWDQMFETFPKGSYLAPLPDMPAMIRPIAPSRASAKEPTRCWDGQWFSPGNLRE